MTAGREHFRLQRILVASQVALSVVLLAGALLFARSLQYLMTRNPGFQQNSVLIANLDTGPLNLSLEQGPSLEQNLLETHSRSARCRRRRDCGTLPRKRQQQQ